MDVSKYVSNNSALLPGQTIGLDTGSWPDDLISTHPARKCLSSHSVSNQAGPYTAWLMIDLKEIVQSDCIVYDELYRTQGTPVFNTTALLHIGCYVISHFLHTSKCQMSDLCKIKIKVGKKKYVCVFSEKGNHWLHFIKKNAPGNG